MFLENLFSNITYEFEKFLQSDSYEGKPVPHLLHSVIHIDGFHFCKRLDWYCIVDKAQGKVLFVDTAHPALTGTEMLDQALERNQIPWGQTTVFLTHFHVDHSGNLRYCLEQGAKEACYLPPMTYHDELIDQYFLWTRSPEALSHDEDTREHLQLLDGKNYFTGIPRKRCRELSAHDELDIAEFHLEVMPTPGHCPEHAVLIDRQQQILFAGDHLIFARPGMMQLVPDQHLLAQYVQSLSDLRKYRFKLVLMSHHEPLVGQESIDAFIKHTQDGYYKLLNDFTDYVAQAGEVSVYEMADNMARNHHPQGLESFAYQEQMRRISLMFGTLEGLYDEGRVERRQDDDGALVYFAKRSR